MGLREDHGRREAARGNTRLRFEQWAKNPGCQANTVSAVHNVRMADVARRVEITPTFGQSPFALARGESFESTLLADGAARLNEELVRHSVVPDGPIRFEDFRLKMNGGPQLTSLDQAIGATTQLLQRVAAEPGLPPTVVAAATARIPAGVMLPEANLIIDVLVVLPATGELVVGEVKTYPDRGGYTSPSDLASARAQAGLYVHALGLIIDELGLADRVHVSTDGMLILSRPGSNQPSLRAHEDLRFQAERARRGFDSLERAALELQGPWSSPAGSEDDILDEVAAATTQYGEACLAFCDLAPRCHAAAVAAGDPAVLGDDIARFLGETDLHRAVDLLNGEPPGSAAEWDLLDRITTTEATVAP